MKRKTWVILMAAFLALPAFSQQPASRPVGEPSAEKVGIQSAQQHLRDITVTQFEDAGFWFCSMPHDQGFVTWRRLNGEPRQKQQLDERRLADQEQLGIPRGDSVLGIKIEFLKRGMTFFQIYPQRPMAIEGITKTMSIWVIGRNFNHTLKIVLSDYFGRVRELTFGKLNFTGWKKLTVAIPPSVVQTDYHYTDRNGIKFLGLRVDCDLAESHGKYYLYLDDLSAVTDLFLESNLDEDDIADIW